MTTACGSSTKLDGRPVSELAGAQLPPNLVASCVDPVLLPTSGGLSAGAVLQQWATDRSELAVCGAKHQAVVDYFTKRDQGLAGTR